MVASVDGETRVSEFLEWALLAGIEETRLGDFRRIAHELFQLSEGARVNESHILRLIDAHSEGPAGNSATSLIEDVGEQLLRFQAARKTSQSITPVPPAPAATPPPRSVRAGSQPFVPRPEERVAGELRPPVTVSANGQASGAVVSFATGSAPPPSPPTPLPPLTPPAPVPAMLNVSSPPPEKTNRRSATLFRCWRCKIMVESDASGVCPRCGTPAPKVASAPVAVVPAPGQRWLVAGGALVAVGLVCVLGAPRLLENLRHPSESVAGEFRSPHLGLDLVFPEEPAAGDGWRHLREGDRAPSANLGSLAGLFIDPLSLRSSRFFRGGAGDPRAELFLVVGARAAGLNDAALAGWTQSAAEIPEKLVDPVRELTGVDNLRLFKCSTGTGVPYNGLRCTGAASRTSALLYVWSTRGNAEVALFLSSAGPEAALEESTGLVTGLQP